MTCPLLYLLLTALVLTSCSRQDAAPTGAPRCKNFVAGDVAMGVDPTVEIGTVFSLINPLGLRIDKISGFTYTSGLPTDSLAYVRRTLAGKPYLMAQGTGNSATVYADQKIHVVDFPSNMTPANQADWLQTLQTLQLRDEGGSRCQSCKSISLRVPAGMEQRWVDELAKKPGVRWAELNCIGGIVLH